MSITEIKQAIPAQLEAGTNGRTATEMPEATEFLFTLRIVRPTVMWRVAVRRMEETRASLK